MTVLEAIGSIALAVVAIGTAVATLIAWGSKQQSKVDKAENQRDMAAMELRLSGVIYNSGQPDRMTKIESDISAIKAQLTFLTRLKEG
jgi:hypothetical protein